MKSARATWSACLWASNPTKPWWAVASPGSASGCPSPASAVGSRDVCVDLPGVAPWPECPWSASAVDASPPVWAARGGALSSYADIAVCCLDDAACIGHSPRGCGRARSFFEAGAFSPAAHRRRRRKDRSVPHATSPRAAPRRAARAPAHPAGRIDIDASRVPPPPPCYRGSVYDAPTGTVALVFTDVQGSTALWEYGPSLMREALAVHDDVLRRAIAELG